MTKPIVTITLATPEIAISDNAKICYGTSGDKDITSSLVHGHGHLAALRFVYVSLTVSDISVACQNQIVRSKHLDFMVQSKRYVNPDKGEFSFVYPELPFEAQDAMRVHWDTSLALYKRLLSEGVKKEDARAILPANTSTKMNITGNLQAWWDFFKLRMNSHAQNEVREVAVIIYDLLADIYPQVFTADVKTTMLEGK